MAFPTIEHKYSAFGIATFSCCLAVVFDKFYETTFLSNCWYNHVYGHSVRTLPANTLTLVGKQER